MNSSSLAHFGTRKLVINAANIHTGGGLALMLELLKAIPQQLHTELILDARASIPSDLSANITCHRVKPTIMGRFLAERLLQKLVLVDDIVLCLGNLPPLFRVQGQVQLFIQNRLLVDPHLKKSLYFKTQLRLTVERNLLRFGCKKVSRFIVQTASMHRLLQENLAIDPDKIRISPFIPASRLADAQPHDELSDARKKLAPVSFDFIYPASGEPYKNHRTLIDAWCILASDDIRPSLAVTVDSDRYSSVCEYLSGRCSQFNLKIQNLGFISPDAIAHAVSDAGAIIYPSLTESFGIPLAEAHVRRQPIIASELDFVRDVSSPNETFDPNSAVSIARAVKRFLGVAEAPRLPECGANEFLEQIVGSAGGYVRSAPC